ncbi:MAG: hypothetical protein Q4B85_08440 [Lachnospiraceae bacterium]|nr:hypothetical protein [Lachnospiraceae bacterium]
MNDLFHTLKRLSVYGVLLLIIILFNCRVIPDSMLSLHICVYFLMFFGICLVVYYSSRIGQEGIQKKLLMALGGLEALFLLIRGIKYAAILNDCVLLRYAWYAYYAPVLWIPLVLFYISMTIDPRRKRMVFLVLKGFGWFTLALILLVFTNDLHQQMFRFQPGFREWNSTYSYGWLYWLITV